MNDVASKPVSRREHLKQATLGLHRRVEQIVDVREYFADRSAYGRWLLASLAFHRAAYARLCSATVAQCLGAEGISRRFGLLERDLADLDIAVPPRMEVAVAVADAAETLGVLYVTEGAALGARVLYARVRDLGLDTSKGAAFLGSQARDMAAWRRFVGALDAFEGTPEEEDRLVQASCSTFELAAVHFGGPP
jgi:heme oxygenase (biliverdin-IX-beta and delta-forming)